MPATPRYGASQADWDNLELGLGLAADLLPVVSNPKAEISAGSSMASIGKTPSRYNAQGKVVGIKDWTKHQSTSAELTKWAAEPDYGICIQTREVRAIDVDIPDRELARQILEFIIEQGYTFPLRTRANSGKFLLAFRLKGSFAKRIIRVKLPVKDTAGKVTEPGWNIEFLATGQQFIAYGTHPSGSRYEWLAAEGLDSDFPEITIEQFEALWAAILAKFGLSEVSGGNTTRKRGSDLGLNDPVAERLDIIGEGTDGQLFIECPWIAEHSADTGLGQTAYFPRGTNGYEQGHFKCFHASCAKRSDVEFTDALGINPRIDDFDAIDAANEKATAAGELDEIKPLPPLIRDSKNRPEPNVLNVCAILHRADATGMALGLDEFRDEIMYHPHGKPGKWRAFADTDYTHLREGFDRLGFKIVGRELIRDCVARVAEANHFDSAEVWLKGLVWDGKPRIAKFVEKYLGAEATKYHEAVSLYWWTALAGRVMEPGAKADMVPILVGPQNIGKSTVIKAIAPHVDFFTEISFDEDEDNLARRMRGRLVAEISELRGMATRELEAIKAFITRTHEDWVPKYKEFAVSYPRRLVFVGTSNKDEFLADETGNRRWLPVRVAKCDVVGVTADRDQLWAEARELWELAGIQYAAAHRLGSDQHAEFMIADAWQDVIEDWLDLKDIDGETPRTREFLRVADVQREALGLDNKSSGRASEMRIGKVLQVLGYEKRNQRLNGIQKKVWVKLLP